MTDWENRQECQQQCWCERGSYNPLKYNSCYECYKNRLQDLKGCIYCGKKHSVEYSTCFDCRQISGRDEAGKNLRLDILIRDDFTCNDCGVREGLEVDHIKPCAKAGLAMPWNLQVLCKDCNLHKGTNWHFGCNWDVKRIELMHLYLTFGWSLLSDDEQCQLLIDTDDYTIFDSRARVLEYDGKLPGLPHWAIDLADEISNINVERVR